MSLRLLMALIPSLTKAQRSFWIDRKFRGSKTPTVDLINSGLLKPKRKH